MSKAQPVVRFNPKGDATDSGLPKIIATLQLPDGLCYDLSSEDLTSLYDSAADCSRTIKEIIWGYSKPKQEKE